MLDLICFLIFFAVLVVQTRQPDKWHRENLIRIRQVKTVTLFGAYALCVRLLYSPRGAWRAGLDGELREAVDECGKRWPYAQSPIFRLLRVFLVGAALFTLITFIFD